LGQVFDGGAEVGKRGRQFATGWSLALDGYNGQRYEEYQQANGL
jgi:hypothetical protein